MTNEPVNQQLVAMCRPGVDIAVDRAIHRADPDRFHRRLNGVCMLCPNMLEELQAQMAARFTEEDMAKMQAGFEKLMAARGEN